MDMWLWCIEFDDQEGIDEIRRYLIMLPSAGGWGRALAAMIETGIIAPSALGVVLNRGMEEEIKRANNKKAQEAASNENS